jgi:hypothetical protein
LIDSINDNQPIKTNLAIKQFSNLAINPTKNAAGFATCGVFY